MKKSKKEEKVEVAEKPGMALVDTKSFRNSLLEVTDKCFEGQTIPILNMVLLQAYDTGRIFLTATNLEVRVQIKLQAEVLHNFAVCINGKRIAAMLKNVDDNKLDIEQQRSQLQVKFENGISKTFTLDAADYPLGMEIKSPKHISISEATLKSTLSRVIFAVSKDDSRKVLNGVLMKSESSYLVFVTTDGKRLAKISCGANLAGNEIECILPLQSVQILCRLLIGGSEESIEIAVSAEIAKFAGQNFELTTKLIEGTYPNYQNIIPKKFEHHVEVGNANFKNALEFVRQHIDQKSSDAYVKFEKSGDMKIGLSATNGTIGAGEIGIFTQSLVPEQFKVQFNPDFLLDFLAVAANSSVIIMNFNGGYTSYMLEADNLDYVVMPIRTGAAVATDSETDNMRDEQGDRDAEEEEDMLKEQNTTEAVNFNESQKEVLIVPMEIYEKAASLVNCEALFKNKADGVVEIAFKPHVAFSSTYIPDRPGEVEVCEVRRACDFSDPTYTYFEITEKWDKNESMRGNMHGLLLTIKGQKYVVVGGPETISHMPTRKKKKKTDTMKVARTLTKISLLPCPDKMKLQKKETGGCCMCQEDDCESRFFNFGDAKSCDFLEACSSNCPRLIK